MIAGIKGARDGIAGATGFRVVSIALDGESVEIGVVGGSYDSGQATATLKLGDKLTVRLPSGEERDGTVFYRGVDAGFATQRDVSRTKRDIKTFEVRLRVDNRDRRLAVGMTAYVLLGVGR